MIRPGETLDAMIDPWDEGRIDRGLADARRWPVTFDVRLFHGDIAQIVDSYRRMGWNVQLVLDSRDGDYLEFSKP